MRLPRRKREWRGFLATLMALLVMSGLFASNWALALSGLACGILGLILTVTDKSEYEREYEPTPRDESDMHDALNDDPRFNDQDS